MGQALGNRGLWVEIPQTVKVFSLSSFMFLLNCEALQTKPPLLPPFFLLTPQN